MFEGRQQWYSDHLPLHFNDHSLHETQLKHFNSSTVFKSKDKPYQCISNHKTKLNTFFIWPRGTFETIFKVKSLTNLIVWG